MNKSMEFDCNVFIQQVMNGDERAIQDLYFRYRSKYFRWISRRFNATLEDFEDAWQDAVMAFYLQVKAGKIIELRLEPCHWLFKVAYRRLLNANRKQKRIVYTDISEESKILPTQEQELFDSFWSDEKKAKLNKALNKLSPTFREILCDRYIRRNSLETIREKWGFNNLNTTSASISRALKQLKTMI
jgi:RNA polymerase sigma factor (sigma-70 family)